jgi:hypothetical protein
MPNELTELELAQIKMVKKMKKNKNIRPLTAVS